MPRTEIGTSERLLAELKEWVLMETPTTDPAAVNRLLDRAEGELAAVGAALTRIPGRDGFGDTLIARTPGEGPPIVVAGHLDTVWDHGTLAGPMPYRVEGERAYGPGIYDMKAGSFLAFHAVREILRQKVPTARPITLLLTPDEEVGSPTSRAIIEREAAGARAVLIPEPAAPDGSCVTARKGWGASLCGWRDVPPMLAAIGRRAQRGGGAGAADPGRARHDRSGARYHHQCGADRRRHPAQCGAARSLVRNRPARARPANGGGDGSPHPCPGGGAGRRHPHHHPRGMNRPAFAETPAILDLYARAAAAAARNGYSLGKQHRGGGSDGNFTAAMGIPTLDGLGCPGGGAHAPQEHILWRELAPRGATLCELLETLA